MTSFYSLLLARFGQKREADEFSGCIPCPGRVQIQGHIAKLCQVVCRLHELIQEHVWKVRRLSILDFISGIVISRVRSVLFDNFDMAPRDLHPACQSMEYQ